MNTMSGYMERMDGKLEEIRQFAHRIGATAMEADARLLAQFPFNSLEALNKFAVLGDMRHIRER